MTIVEFFSEEALENIMALLSFHPERIIYLGHKHNMITRKMKSLRRFASITSPDTVLEFIEVPRDDLPLCIRTIEDICEEYPEAEFELTGGGEMFLRRGTGGDHTRKAARAGSVSGYDRDQEVRRLRRLCVRPAPARDYHRCRRMSPAVN